MFDKNDYLSVNAIRCLSVAQIEKANSGHPGIVMGAAPMIYTLWNKFLNVYPKEDTWFNRDRFVLSAGHGSALLYSLLHLSGFDLTIDDLKKFRQLGSKTPGHPERLHTKGVEVTTGPLGQGIANSVGLAMAEKHMAALYNKKGMNIIDHYTYCLCGDGDLMEGISYESMSLAGHLGLNKLIVLYDSNDVCLDGELSTSFSENIEKRADALNWNYIKVGDGENLEDIYIAIEKARKEQNKPSIIEVKTVIGYGSKNQATNKVHGSPLGKEDFSYVKKVYDWTYEDFEIPSVVYEKFKDNLGKRGKKAYISWEKLLEDYRKSYKKDYQSLMKGIDRNIDTDLFNKIKKYDSTMPDIASRSSSGEIIQDIAKYNKNFWGGSADLFGSNKTEIKGSHSFKDDGIGKNVWYGVREFAMAAIGNGIMAHGGSFHFVSTFFVFADYLKPAIRLSALSKLPLIYVFTHDSVAVGEDGPTHEPIEQLAMLRSIPNTIVLRPADANEVRLSWKLALESKESPVVLILSRQNLQNLEGSEKIDSIEKGAYVIEDSKKGTPDGIIIATGSEVSLAIKAKKKLEDEGIDLRVVSMPSMELFRKQDASYKESILPSSVTNRMTIEMASSFGWKEFSLDKGINLSIDRFGISGEGDEVANELGFSAENIVNIYKKNFVN